MRLIGKSVLGLCLLGLLGCDCKNNPHNHQKFVPETKIVEGAVLGESFTPRTKSSGVYGSGKSGFVGGQSAEYSFTVREDAGVHFFEATSDLASKLDAMITPGSRVKITYQVPQYDWQKREYTGLIESLDQVVIVP